MKITIHFSIVGWDVSKIHTNSTWSWPPAFSDTRPAVRTALPLVHASRISPSENSEDFHVGQEIAPGPAPLARANCLPSGETGSRN